MKRTLGLVALTVALVLLAVTGCGRQPAPSSSTAPSPPSVDSSLPTSDPAPSREKPTLRIAALKGATGLGMVHLMEQQASDRTQNNYEFTLAGAPDEITGKILTGELDIAAVPVNLAAVLYNKSDKALTFLGVNTLGVNYLLTNGVEITSLEDLRGKTIHLVGQGATPEYSLRYLLTQAGLNPDSDVTLVFESENPALQAKLVAGEVEIAVLPEPFVSVVTSKNPQISIALDLTAQWELATDGAVLTTGGVIVRNEYLAANPETVATFMEEYAQSCQLATTQLEDTARLAVQYEILPSEEIAKLAIPRSNIQFLHDTDSDKAVALYLKILFGLDPKAVGGAVPDEAFYNNNR